MEAGFIPNLALPVHRWFRWSAGFPAAWAASQIEPNDRVLDPFAGSGTTLLAAEERGADGQGLEAHPFVLRVARAKLAWRTDPEALRRRAARLLEDASDRRVDPSGTADLLQRCYRPEALRDLLSLRAAWEAADDHSPESELAWLALAAVLRPCADAGTAPWQYVLPGRRKKAPREPRPTFAARCEQMALDMTARRADGPPARAHQDDARRCAAVAPASIDRVITSPPYANNYDYADATRLEMTFFGDVSRWRDLQGAVRQHLLRACTQHVAAAGDELEPLLADPVVATIREPLEQACRRLDALRVERKGRKPYHRMAAAYFVDMARVWQALRRVCRPGAAVTMIVGDSAPYGVHLPVERWLGELAVAAGFETWRFEETRRRNTKWRNRKHTVPLREGHLEVRG